MSKFEVGDKVKILDGSKIKDYRGSWVQGMKSLIGHTAKITRVIEPFRGSPYAYKVDVCSWTFDERGLEAVESENNFEIVITTDGKRTRAAKYENDKKTVETIARCSPDDTFDFMTGAKLAFNRLIDEESGRDLRELLKTGVFGKMKKHGYFVIANKSIIYENGGFDRIDQFNKNLRSYIGDNLYDEVVEIYDGVNCFDAAKDSFLPPPTIWKR